MLTIPGNDLNLRKRVLNAFRCMEDVWIVYLPLDS